MKDYMTRRLGNINSNCFRREMNKITDRTLKRYCLVIKYERNEKESNHNGLLYYTKIKIKFLK